jgi:shikimate kinase
MHICITGLRSVGKSTLAQSLALTHGMSFHDTDIMADHWLTRSGSSFLDEMRQRRYERIYDAILAGLPAALDDPNGSVVAAGWGCFQHPDLARVLTDRTFVVAIIPSADPEMAAAELYPRERSRSHFDYLTDEELMELCTRDARIGITLLAQHCHATLVVGGSDAESIHLQLQALLIDAARSA